VLYVADGLGTCGAEVFGDTKEASICPNFRVVIAAPRTPVQLQILFGPAVMQIGATVGLGAGYVPRRVSQEWARAIYEDDPAGVQAEGVRYVSAHDGLYAAALWDRAPELLVATLANGSQSDAALLDQPVLLAQFIKQMSDRAITFRMIDSSDCHRCLNNPPAA
jgi:hypothetical protein